ncbi:Ig-like domain-containing protein [Candidatus Roizmanbacteria bacterium]|nr:Ig-like domain-containing protein [Candidatus Roizmanbacteria bacterium]
MIVSKTKTPIQPPQDIIPTSTKPTSITIPSPTLILGKQLKVIDINPKNEQTLVPLDTKLVILLNDVFTDEEVTFSIGPSVNFTRQIQDKSLVITFNQSLTPGTLYTYTIKFPNSPSLPQSFTFTTAGPTQRFLPNTFPGEVE